MALTDTAPLSLVGAALFLILLICVEIGFRMRSRAKTADGQTGSQEFLLSAVLGLLALLLGFTFSMALNRYDGRRDLVVQESNAIGTTWLRAQLLHEPDKTEMSDALRRYVDARIVWSQVDSREAPGADTSALQARLWALTGHVTRTETSEPIVRGLMEAMNQSFDLQAARAAARRGRIPGRVFEVLLLYAAISMIMLGYILALSRQRHLGATSLLVVLLSLALVVIVDLDRPRSGAITVSQQPLIDLRASMR